jgi:hypothetical protein
MTASLLVRSGSEGRGARVCATPARAAVERLDVTIVEIVTPSQGDADPGHRRPVGEPVLVPADWTLPETAFMRVASSRNKTAAVWV